jgi:hypothetical protein
MEISTQRFNVIEVRVTEDFVSGVNEIAPFLSSLPKLKGIINKAGFRNEFTSDEKKIWNAIFSELIQEQKPNGVQTI